MCEPMMWAPAGFEARNDGSIVKTAGAGWVGIVRSRCNGGC